MDRGIDPIFNSCQFFADPLFHVFTLGLRQPEIRDVVILQQVQIIPTIKSKNACRAESILSVGYGKNHFDIFNFWRSTIKVDFQMLHILFAYFAGRIRQALERVVKFIMRLDVRTFAALKNFCRNAVPGHIRKLAA